MEITISRSIEIESSIAKEDLLIQIENELNQKPNDQDRMEIVLPRDSKDYQITVSSIDNKPLSKTEEKKREALRRAQLKKEMIENLHYPLLKNIDYLELIGTESIIHSLTIDEATDRINWIRNQPFQEQRSEEWYAFRNSMITASELYKLFGSDKVEKSFIESKTNIKKQKTGNACKHGIMYEELARRIYEQRNRVVVHEFGCVRHQTVPFLGASPDGICIHYMDDVAAESNPNMIGRIVEIKCPTTRVIDGKVPLEYALQVQTQLEVLNLEECDYCEFQFKEFATKEEYDVFDDAPYFEKGIILSASKMNSDINSNEHETFYVYSDFSIRGEEKEKWLERETSAILSIENSYINKIIYWKLEVFHCKTIKRNRTLFNKLLPRVTEVWGKIETQRASLVLSLPSSPQNEEVSMDVDDSAQLIQPDT